MGQQEQDPLVKYFHSSSEERGAVALVSFFETEETNQFTFEAFAAHPFYTAINRSRVQQALAPLSGSICN
jgi:hypothetical protein